MIAGIAKGRRLRAAPGSRPTADSVKEALFSTLGPQVAGGRVLDLYAGSGALGIEALSRGAEAVTFVERDPRAVSAIRTNLEATGFSGQARVVEAPVQRFLAGGRPASPEQEESQGTGAGERAAFDLVLADPPYADDPAGVLDLLSRSPLLAPHALVALEVAAERLAEPHGPAAAGGLAVRSVRRYGDSAILYAAFAEPIEETQPGQPAEPVGPAADAGAGGGTG